MVGWLLVIKTEFHVFDFLSLRTKPVKTPTAEQLQKKLNQTKPGLVYSSQEVYRMCSNGKTNKSSMERARDRH